MSGRDPADLRQPRVLGYAGRSPRPVPPVRPALRRVPVRVPARRNQLPGVPGPRPSSRSRRSPPRARPPMGAHRRCRVVGVPREQAHVPAEQPPAVQDPRLPAADAHPRGPGDPRRSPAQGSREALRLRCCPRRHACAGVRSSPRSSGPVGAPVGRPWFSTTCPSGSSRHPPPDSPSVARAGFVVGKAVGNSVVRHRVTRRLRAVVRDELHRLPSTADLVVRARPEAATAPFAVLHRDLVRGAGPAAGRPPAR